jgi:hypothetical protein
VVPKNRPILHRIVGMSRSWGMNGLILVNLFAWRTSDPRQLKLAAATGHDIVGALNDTAIEAALRESELTIAAWGNKGAFQNRAAEVAKMLREGKCLALTNRSHPRHPRAAKQIASCSDLLDFRGYQTL